MNVISRGLRWSKSVLLDGWGEDTTDFERRELGQLVVCTFNDLAAAAGSAALWEPDAGCVTDDPHDVATADQADRWRVWSVSKVWAACRGVCDDDVLQATVANVLGLERCATCGIWFNPVQNLGWMVSGGVFVCAGCGRLPL